MEIFVIGLSYDFGIAGPHTSDVLTGVACLVVVVLALMYSVFLVFTE